ncbi:AP-3 complex subunit beta [Meloidogyne graminicola]|uniref:AP-3 complex subunit beta n=1 Tax=Meloidogyne graminicola TaxID=189291 RepID=A0A8S9ZAZ8_9BILA|nr:AP-3 complex subunit beta [Meloidogyne graminicola]
MRMTYPMSNTPEIEIAESGTILDNKGKFNDLKVMLDSNKENVKVDAMRRIINMVARGKDVSDLFPAVVKNVAAKNLELKKLVYVYLVRYAEEQQDLALLSISTFQRGLKDPNQLIRASALRVLSSIRVQMIAPVMMLAIRESVRDMSPYVRKVAAHAIPKLFALDPELQNQLIECIDFLLGDKRTLVLGSAVYAFEKTCPERLDLLHKHFRLLCRALADIDEWGQIVMIGLLTRYARTQFLAPFDIDSPIRHNIKNKISNASDNNDDQSYEDNQLYKTKFQTLDPDHNLLLVAVRPLLQSRNPAVVMAVAQLLYYIAPFSQLSAVPRALVRLLRGTNEVSYIVLVNIASMICSNNPRWKNEILNDEGEEGEKNKKETILGINKTLFLPFLKNFFVRSSDTLQVKQLKLNVLTCLVDESNVQLVIRELQAYMQMTDLAEEAVEAIGRCALAVPSAASETCLATLVRIISEPNTREEIVCVAVVVLKRLLHSEAPLLLLKKISRLMENAPLARACIIWLIGMHIDKVPNIAPDLLRKIAKTFADEDDCVKLQALNLAVRIWINETKSGNKNNKITLLINYIFQLARYDRSYDIRDRCPTTSSSSFEQKIFDNNFKDDSIIESIELSSNKLTTNNTSFEKSFMNEERIVDFPLDIFLNDRPAPFVQNPFADRVEHFQLGTLSHLLNQKCFGYEHLPEFPTIQPDPNIRRNAYPLPSDSLEFGSEVLNKKGNELNIEDEYRSVESGSDEEDEEEYEDEEQDDEEEEDNEQEEEEEGEEEEDGSDIDELQNYKKIKELTKNDLENSKSIGTADKIINQNNHIDTEDLLLLEIDFGSSSINVTSSTSSTLPTTDIPIRSSPWLRASAQWAMEEFTFNLVNPIISGGLSIIGRFCRYPCLYSSSMVCLELQICFKNSQINASNVHLAPVSTCSLQTSGPITLNGLGEGERRRITIGIDFNDSAQISEWTVKWANDERNVKFEIQAPYGEQIEAVQMSQNDFLKQRAKLIGMNQIKINNIQIASDVVLSREVYKICNCKQISVDDEILPGMNLCFAAQTVSHKILVLISFFPEKIQELKSEQNTINFTTFSIQINCENIAFASMLAQELSKHLNLPYK